MFASGAPFAAAAASHAAYAAGSRVQQAQVASSHQVRAVLTQAAGTTFDGYTVVSFAPAQATWTSPSGGVHTGQVMAPAGSPRGTAVTVWTDAAGDLTNPPLEPSQVAGQADMAAIGAITVVGLLCLCAAVTTRKVLYRRRMAAWEAEWVVTARAWNRQRW